ncbi:GNAT family N-acetyltransferase [Rathayibacter sp. VKM Ac-2803]|uniref:GNAT family N-acetyltransferase n=1 Tax=Rathayibacter sp. VKM Ac-2803 TaxID=2609256 RepID=UPI00135C1598|nr:GNAT family N-acetyltransferase [Rathayibacter sp. VKM Ac-2803]MWV48028.1 GNAT family N-acetyltransferase [Rathayibacter sp. VKM Ac-2803]
MISDYLRVYDDQLRTDAETPSAVSVTRVGPLRLVTFAGGRGFVTYRDLGGAEAEAIRELVAAARAHFEADPGIRKVEWKTRGHDRAPGLHEALIEHGFAPEETESIMIGPLEALTRDAPVPDGVTLRRVVDEPDVRAFSAMIDAAFGEEVDTGIADSLVVRLARADGMELWVAEVDGRMVSGGRLEPVPCSDVVGIWGGATLEEYRGRGIYRALTASRAGSALDLGRTLVHSDSTEYSRPILERSGLVKVSTTTPYLWRR